MNYPVIISFENDRPEGDGWERKEIDYDSEELKMGLELGYIFLQKYYWEREMTREEDIATSNPMKLEPGIIT